ncbi:RIP metalloprotease RseP [Campylobacter sp. MIT 99-7217]|uniref:RIP metalloprotease RseP n=1 Tax=Campylobacter sp. MIT 99-7217 TaxID=535091 RepID=UPI00115BFDE8|nr:RIP metalloprotease RseP [Campylobacter sp. MIT 99-7217]TQR33051.1 RIP metalloprotease RseP [Campylobacter sp. MIT 99-7217]
MKSLLFLLSILAIGMYFYSFEFLITLLVISFLIFFHELGHFLAAKSLGVKVEVFSIGFGNALVEKEFKNTKYRLSALPFGGYVKLKGQEDLNPSKQVFEKDSYSVLSPLQKIYILFAGPFFNIFLAFLLFICIGFLGTLKPASVVGGFSEKSAAFEAGIRANDEIVSINGVLTPSFDTIAPLVKDTNLLIEVKRAGEILHFNVTPNIGEAYNDFGQKIQKPLLGIAPSTQRVMIYHTGLDSFSYAFKESLNTSSLILKGLLKLINGEIEAKNLGGVISIVDITSKASSISLSTLFFITALISINLGLLNLLPIPMLDGGHILFNLYELCFKRKVPPKAFEYLSYTGLALLLSLMIFATYNDIMRFATQN